MKQPGYEVRVLAVVSLGVRRSRFDLMFTSTLHKKKHFYSFFVFFCPQGEKGDTGDQGELFVVKL